MGGNQMKSKTILAFVSFFLVLSLASCGAPPLATQSPAPLTTSEPLKGPAVPFVEGRVKKVDLPGFWIETNPQHEEVLVEISDQTIQWDGITWIAEIPVEIGDFVTASGTWNPDQSFAAIKLYVNIVNLRGKVGQVVDQSELATFEMMGLNQKVEQISLAPQTILYEGETQSKFQDSHHLPRTGDQVQVIGRRLKDGTVIAVNIYIP